MVKGTVKWFHSRKGYGFITQEEGGDIFVHFSEIVAESNTYKTLYQGDVVEFEVVDGKKGPQAHNVKVLERTTQKPERKPRSEEESESEEEPESEEE
jgi:CspA family cold shock protein